LTPTHGRAPRGERVVGRIPQRRWTAVTLLATLTPDGFGPSFQFNGALDRTVFTAYVERILAPALRPGQTVILDNLSVHKSARARALIEAAGCRVRFLPTYSPDFNPIEQAFSQLKGRLRRAEARSVEAILDASADAYADLTAEQARNYDRNAGYKL
jgi:transposase